MKWFWIIPDPDEFVSGGNIYNSNLLSALASHEVSSIIATPPNLQYSFNQTIPDVIIWDTYHLDELFIHNKPQTSKVFLLVHMITKKLLDRLPDIQLQVNGFITTSNWSTGQLVAHGIPSKQILTIEPGTHLQTVEIGEERNSPSDKLMLILVANLVPEKGHENLFLALKQNTNTANFFQIDLYGDDRINPEWAQYLLGQIKHLGLSEIVHFKGRIAHHEILTKMLDYHALLSVSPTESYGLAIREALSIHLPVLAISGGHVPYLVKDGLNGYLYDDISGLISWLTLPLTEQFNLLTEIENIENLLPIVPSWETQTSILYEWICRQSAKCHVA